MKIEPPSHDRGEGQGLKCLLIQLLGAPLNCILDGAWDAQLIDLFSIPSTIDVKNVTFCNECFQDFFNKERISLSERKDGIEKFLADRSWQIKDRLHHGIHF